MSTLASNKYPSHRTHVVLLCSRLYKQTKKHKAPITKNSFPLLVLYPVYLFDVVTVFLTCFYKPGLLCFCWGPSVFFLIFQFFSELL